MNFILMRLFSKIVLSAGKLKILIIFLGFSLSCKSDTGLEPLAQELFIGETAFVQEQGEIQFGLEGSYFNLNDFKQKELNLEVEYGISNRLTISIELPYLNNEFDQGSVNGFGDLELGFLYNIIQQDNWLLTFGTAANLRTGNEDKGLGEEDFEWEPSLRAVFQIDDSQLSLALGAEISSDENHPFFSSAWVFPVGQVIGLVEVYGFFAEDNNDQTIETDEQEGNIGYFAPGIKWSWGDNMEFQAGIPIGLTDSTADWSIVVKWNIELD